MALIWKVIVCRLEDAQEEGTGTWEPIQVVEDDDGTKLLVCKGLFEREGDRSSTREENKIWTPEGE